MPRAAAAGLTGGYDAWAAAPSEQEAYEIWHSISESGELSLRIFGSVRETDSAHLIANRFKKFEQNFSTEIVRPEAIKLAVDGVPEGHTAFLLTPYVDSTNEDFGNR